MSEEKIGNRNVVVLGAIIVQLCLGSIYAWSIFQKALYTTIADGGLYEWDKLWSNLPFAAGLASFALFMIFAGRWQDRVGPRKVATVGGILLGIGVALSGLVDILGFSANIVTGTLYLVITYGIIGGAGIGFAYVCPIAALVKWFPDKKGLMTGVAVAGFGGGALIFNYVEQYLIGFFGGYIGYPLIVLGVIYLVFVVIGSQMLVNPPAGWLPEGFTPPPTTADGAGTGIMPGQMARTSDFWVLWLMFALAATAGLMTLGNVVSAAVDIDPIVDTLELGALIAGIMSIFNAAGRIVWGRISDSIGRNSTFIAMFLVLAIAMFAFAFVPVGTSWILVTVIASVIGFCFGGNFALFPSATADYFGSEHVGKNYGVVFTAYGIAGILGALVAGTFGAIAGYSLAFLITGVLAIIAIVLTLVLRTKRGA
ncbi:MFS transporter [Candidatus Thorarchaeota archaeon]|nr:MAG: MFS transporter [Candidatus Thorarchaeota archaeon]